MSKKPATIARDQRLIAAFDDGADIYELCDRFGLGVSHVKTILLRSGRTIRNDSARAKIAARNEGICEAWRSAGEARNIFALARQFNLSPGAIRYILKKHGLVDSQSSPAPWNSRNYHQRMASACEALLRAEIAVIQRRAATAA